MNEMIFPKDWKITKLSDVCLDIQPGFAQGKKNVEGGTIHLRMNNIGTNFKINYKLIRTVEPSIVQLKKYMLKKGDIIFNNTNSPKLVGKSAIFQDSKECLYSNHLTRLRVNHKILLPSWLLFYIQLKWKTRDFEEMCNQWINQAAVNSSKIKNLDVPIPPLEIQKKIIQKLDYIFTEFEEKKNSILELYNKIMKEYKIFQKKIVEHIIETSITKQTENFEKLPLSKICSKITDGTHKTPTYTNEGISFLRVKDIHHEEIDWHGVKRIPKDEHLKLIKRCKPEKGDILYSKNGTIGISKVIDWNEEFSIFVSLALLKPKKEIVDSYFLKYFLDSSTAKKQALKRSKTATVTNLHLEEIREIIMPLPPIEIQRKMVKQITRQLEKFSRFEEDHVKHIQNKEQNLTYINNLQYSMLVQAFSGKLVN